MPNQTKQVRTPSFSPRRVDLSYYWPIITGKHKFVEKTPFKVRLVPFVRNINKKLLRPILSFLPLPSPYKSPLCLLLLFSHFSSEEFFLLSSPFSHLLRRRFDLLSLLGTNTLCLYPSLILRSGLYHSSKLTLSDLDLFLFHLMEQWEFIFKMIWQVDKLIIARSNSSYIRFESTDVLCNNLVLWFQILV